MAKSDSDSKLAGKLPSKGQRELALREAQSARWDLASHLLVTVVTFPLYLIDKLRVFIGLCGLGYFCVYLPLTAISGERTEFIFDMIVDLAINQWVYWLVVLLLTGSNVFQFFTHRKYIRRHGQRERDLESHLDSKRSGSGLSPSGTPTKKRENQNGS